LRILIAEDDALSRELLLKALSEFGECDVCINGMEALEAVLSACRGRRPAYAIICLDIMMPKVDGIMVLRAIRDAERQMKVPLERRSKVIILSALGEAQARNAGLDARYDAYVTKPLDSDKLRQIVRELLPRKE
jgi:two-component system chemotaxis response regulator CheY